jgi:hypothetical protein
MPLSPCEIPRKRLHSRRVTYDGWQRDDGLFDIEARLIDVKDDDYALASGVRPKGTPIHEMSVRVTIDSDFVIRALEARSDAVPYADGCELIAPAYSQLVGANLMHGFRGVLYDLLGGVKGCSHLTELLAFLPTAAVQTFASLHPEHSDNVGRPYQLDRCHALEHTTETVRRYYPKWFRGAA